MNTTLRRVLSSLVLCAAAGSSSAQLTWVQSLPSPPGFAFSTCLAAHEDLIAAGSWFSERVEIYRRDAGLWTHVEEITAHATGTGVRFAEAVDVYEDLLVVGAPEQLDAGLVHVFRRQAGTEDWNLEATLFADDGVAGDGFGQAVSVHGTTIAVAARSHHHPLNHVGAVYLFEATGGPGASWIQTAELQTPNPNPPAFRSAFGLDLDLNGNRLLVSNIGEAHLFERLAGSWVPLEDLTPSGYFTFGRAVALSEQGAIVGDTGYPSNGPFQVEGTAHLFAPNAPSGSWNKVLRIRPIGIGSQFGLDVAAAGEIVVATDDGAAQIGSELQVYRRTPSGQWVFDSSFRQVNPLSLVAIAGNDIIVRNRDVLGASFLSVLRKADGPRGFRSTATLGGLQTR